jgi:NAD(P)-dependent dehydrogenase (short-subunit alcohol dehydrogenase family)
MSAVLITGCSSGLGRATALAFARRGDRVYATVRAPASGAGLLDDAKAEGLSIEMVEMDVSDDNSVTSSVSEVLEAAGDIDVLVNNAGISHYGTVELMPWDWFRQMFETNFWGPVRTIRAVLPSMRARGSGVIVNVSSAAGRIPGLGFVSAYSATKHALGNLSEALAMEVEPFNIRVAVIEPGWHQTDIVNKGNVVLDPKSPYATLEAAEYASEQAAVKVGAHPSTVADAIIDVVTNGGPLHVVVGDDAKSWIDAAHDATFEEWLEVAKQQFFSA